MTSTTFEHAGVDPVAAVAALVRAAGLVAVIAALIMVCTAKLNSLASNSNWREGFVSAEDRTRQLECLARNIYWEAANEPFEGKVAVAQVTMNRVESGRFPGSVCGVVYQKNVIYEKVICQFTWYCESTHRVRPVHQPLWRESQEVAKKVLLEGFRLPSLGGAMFYHADYIPDPGWSRNMTRVGKIGRHIFYKKT